MHGHTHTHTPHSAVSVDLTSEPSRWGVHSVPTPKLQAFSALINSSLAPGGGQALPL